MLHLLLILTLMCWVLSKVASSTIFWVFGMTWPGIEPQSSGPLADTLLIRPMARWFMYDTVYLIGQYHIYMTNNPTIIFLNKILMFFWTKNKILLFLAEYYTIKMGITYLFLNYVTKNKILPDFLQNWQTSFHIN